MLIILIGAFLLALPISNNDGHWLGFVDSFFTSTSAVCVTGLVVVDTATQFSLFGQFVILFLIQVGGLGIVVLTSCIFLLLKKKINFSNRIVLKESFNRDTIQGVVKYLKKVILLTFIIEGVGAICLLGSTIAFFGNFWKGLFSAVFMSVSAFCNAGFDIFGNEMMQFQGMSSFASNVLMQLPIMMLIIIGGLGFIVLIEGFKKFKNNQHARVAVFMTIGLLVGGAIVFMFVEWNNPRTLGNMPWWQKVLNSFFQSTTTRTAGMATFDQAGLTPSGTILTILLMFIGGCPTSTSGGIKTTTLFIILLVLFKQPNENGHIVYKDRKISAKIIMKAFKIVMYMVAMLIISIVVLSLIEGDMYSVEVIIFECVSAISTVGLSMGITPLLSTASKVIVALLMFVGRVGMTTIVLALSTKSNKISEEVEYLNTDIIVG
ncbi:MAG: Trk family potassium uptake protein [Clostridia bacterium]|nr:Trk family potassium uptake protein [Clostridia bacterium]